MLQDHFLTQKNMFDDLIDLIPQIEHQLLASLVVILVLWVIRKVMLAVIQRHVHDVRTRYRLRQTLGFGIAAIGILIFCEIWFVGFTSFTTFLGLVSAGVAIALKDLLIDLAGWMFILWRQPFKVGDRIQIGALAGDVIDMRLFQFTLLEIGNWVDADQSTGRVIHVPNGQVFREPQANYTQGFHYIWNELPVMLTFESNWEKAKELLNAIAMKHTHHLCEAAEEGVKEAGQKYLIFYSKLTPIVYTSVREYGILLTIRHLTEPRRRRGTSQAIWEDMLREFARCPDISFAYPTQRFYSYAVEGPTHPHPPGVPAESGNGMIQRV